MDRVPEQGFRNVTETKKCIEGKLNNAFLHFLSIFLPYLMIFQSSTTPLACSTLKKIIKNLAKKNLFNLPLKPNLGFGDDPFRPQGFSSEKEIIGRKQYRTKTTVETFQELFLIGKKQLGEWLYLDVIIANSGKLIYGKEVQLGTLIKSKTNRTIIYA